MQHSPLTCDPAPTRAELKMTERSGDQDNFYSIIDKTANALTDSSWWTDTPAEAPAPSST